MVKMHKQPKYGIWHYFFVGSILLGLLGSVVFAQNSNEPTSNATNVPLTSKSNSETLSVQQKPVAVEQKATPDTSSKNKSSNCIKVIDTYKANGINLTYPKSQPEADDYNRRKSEAYDVMQRDNSKFGCNLNFPAPTKVTYVQPNPAPAPVNQVPITTCNEIEKQAIIAEFDSRKTQATNLMNSRVANLRATIPSGSSSLQTAISQEYALYNDFLIQWKDQLIRKLNSVYCQY
ncbi:MAG TPA: hypothetical protein VK983_01590 [Candidatus Limnocylindrales bacterium]|nr:hypothetical protein [Candidatus Limnocylindrales bacterium]